MIGMRNNKSVLLTNTANKKAGQELKIPHQIVWKILWKQLKTILHKLQLLKSLSNQDKITYNINVNC